MYHKLGEEDLNRLMENGIHVFAKRGFNQAKMSEIAKKSGLSVGVLYNYFDGKDDFFLYCVRYSVKPLAGLMDEIELDPDNIKGNIEMILRSLFQYCREHNDYFVLYQEITAGGCKKFAPQLVEEIETVTVDVYSRLFERAIASGKVRSDMNPSLFAFFFDNLLMMLHFSLSCDYYKQRMEMYTKGEPDEEVLIQELLKFISGALGIKD